METTLLIVTLASVALAGLLALLLLRVLREERRRSDARIAVLQALAAFPAEDDMDYEPPTGRRSPAVLAPRVTLRDDRPTPVVAASSAADLVLHEAPDDPMAPNEGHTLFQQHELFEQEEAPSPWPRRVGVVASLAALVLVLGVAWQWGKSELVPAAPTAAGVVDQPLELLSLSHAYEEGALTISGIVLNPGGGRLRQNLEASALVFDASGAQIASGRAAIGLAEFAAGTESPFVVRVPVSGGVARYRVGFRTADGAVAAHIDRRAADPVARKEVP